MLSLLLLLLLLLLMMMMMMMTQLLFLNFLLILFLFLLYLDSIQETKKAYRCLVLRLEENQFRCTWNFTAIESHGDVTHDWFFSHEGRVELRVTELDHVTWNMSIINDDLNAATAGRARVDCAQNTAV